MSETQEKTCQSRNVTGDGKCIVGANSNKMLPGSKRRGSDLNGTVVELSTDNNAPGVLRIFGDSVRPGTHYKSVLATMGSTACELVKEALSRYNILEQKTGEYLLCEVIGKFDESSANNSTTKSGESRGKTNGENNKQRDLDLEDWSSEYVRVIDGNDRPLLLQELWKPMEGYARRFEIRRKDDVLKAVSQDKTTTGINSNARKIQMAKVKPGVIPRGNENDDQRKKSTLQIPRKESLVSNIRRSSSRTDSSSSVDSLSYGAYYPDRHSELPKAPANSPFLLTLRGFDIRRDKLYYLIEDDVCVLGGLTQPVGKAPSILLNAPDVLSQHCSLCRRKMQTSSKYSDAHQIVEIEPEPGAKVTVNGWAVYSRIVLASGDLITIGDHYVFLYKDLTAGQDIPMELPWLQDCGRTHSPQTSPVEFSSPEEEDKIFEFGGKNRQESKGDSNGRITKRRKAKNVDKWRFSDMSDDDFGPRFSYSKDSEDDMIRAVVTVVDPFEDSYKLSPAFLYSTCLDFSKRTFGLCHTKNLLSRILACLRDITLKCSSMLTEESFGESLLLSHTSPEARDGLHHARPVIFWMSNCIQTNAFVKSVLFQNLDSDTNTITDSTQKPSDKETLLSQFEEIVKFGFQQTVYSTTKVLYHYVPLMLDSNPFDEEHNADSTDVITILDDIYKITDTLQLDVHVQKQIFTYLFFFISTTVFNKLISKASGNKYFCWHAGVRIAGNLQQLEDWSSQYGFQSDYQIMFKELASAVDLLATAKGKLLQMSWAGLRKLAPNLTVAQLYHILMEYQVGAGKEIPSGWLPGQEDLTTIQESSTIQIKLADHPPFTLPKEDVCVFDIHAEIKDQSLLQHMQTITSNFGMSEDDDDSGYSVSNAPRLTSTSKSDPSESFSLSDECSVTKLTLPPRIPKPLSGNLFGLKSGNLISGQPSSLGHEPRDRSSYSHSSQDGDISEELDTSEIHLSFRETSLPESFPKTVTSGSVGSTVESGCPTTPLAGNISKPFGTVNSKCKLWKTAGWQESFSIDVTNVETLPKRQDSGLRVLSLEENTVATNSFDMGTVEWDLPLDGIQTEDEEVPAMTAMTTAYLKDSHEDVVRVNLLRDKGGLGLGLIDGLHTSLHCPGLFVRTVVPGSPADKNGRIRIGDKLLAVNGTALLGADYQTAMTLIRNAGNQLQLVIARNDSETAMRLSSTTC